MAATEMRDTDDVASTVPAQPRSVADPPSLIAYRVHSGVGMPIVPAERSREWMDATDERFANRCLPLLIANQAGWFILNTHELRVTWNGGEEIEDLKVKVLSGDPPYPASSHFGHAILTWHIPFLFRTPPGYQLLARGPSNWPKDGISPLEGIVETDWASATFTMNWKVTRPRVPVTFAVGEPICMVVPIRCDTLETFQPQLDDLVRTPDYQKYLRWSADRSKFLSELGEPESESAKLGWQKDYFRGQSRDGARAPVHRTKIHLNEFQDGICPPDEFEAPRPRPRARTSGDSARRSRSHDSSP
jgi:Family of unknown function (DUF6065)